MRALGTAFAACVAVLVLECGRETPGTVDRDGSVDASSRADAAARDAALDAVGSEGFATDAPVDGEAAASHEDASPAADGAGPSSSCAGDAGPTFSAWIQDASMGRMCDFLLCNVEIRNTGTGSIGPITVTTVYVPSVGASWSTSTPTPYPAIGPGQTAVITIGDSAPMGCGPLSCPGPVELEMQISGPGIPSGTRACGLSQVGGC
jgi:hypothetical protein